MSKGLPDPLNLFGKGVLGIRLPDPLGIMKGSKEHDAKMAALRPPTPTDVPTRGGPADPAIEKRATEHFPTRDALAQRQAVAAGAQRSENDADLLGNIGNGARKRGAARRLLGGD